MMPCWAQALLLARMPGSYRASHRLLLADRDFPFLRGHAISPLGLVAGHAYCILRVVQLDAQLGGHKLLQLRNPWGEGFVWKGFWSDEDECWTPQLKEVVQFRRQEGCFWMSWDDFLQVFLFFFLRLAFDEPMSLKDLLFGVGFQNFDIIYVCRTFDPHKWQSFTLSSNFSLAKETLSSCRIDAAPRAPSFMQLCTIPLKMDFAQHLPRGTRFAHVVLSLVQADVRSAVAS